MHRETSSHPQSESGGDVPASTRAAAICRSARSNTSGGEPHRHRRGNGQGARRLRHSARPRHGRADGGHFPSGRSRSTGLHRPRHDDVAARRQRASLGAFGAVPACTGPLSLAPRRSTRSNAGSPRRGISLTARRGSGCSPAWRYRRRRAGPRARRAARRPRHRGFPTRDHAPSATHRSRGCWHSCSRRPC